jgi:poly(3-hydroxybutyrate) depolymerase
MSAAERALDEVRSLLVDGRNRTYRLFVPPAVNAKEPSPLIIVLHGGRMTFDRIVEERR